MTEAAGTGALGLATDAERELTALLRLMQRLRDPQKGCPWDLEQTFATIAPYTIEEAYEVADAIEDGRPEKIRDELGDLLFQVVFHSQMALERGWFDFGSVARSIHDKLVRRHPHIFGSATVTGTQELLRTWEEMKAAERAAATPDEVGGKTSALADIPRGLPALTRAAKLGRRAARVGFDWTEDSQVRAKVVEEMQEIDAAAAAAEADHVFEEIGDLLFSVVNWSRHLQVDPEDALRAANAKFEKRFRSMEALAASRGETAEKLTPVRWEELWQEAKKL